MDASFCEGNGGDSGGCVERGSVQTDGRRTGARRHLLRSEQQRRPLCAEDLHRRTRRTLFPSPDPPHRISHFHYFIDMFLVYSDTPIFPI